MFHQKTLKRILKDIQRCQLTGAQGFKEQLDELKIHLHFYEHDYSNVLVMIEGPQYSIDPYNDQQRPTPYFGGYYLFKITFPTDYPMSPIKISFMSRSPDWRCHPNYYSTGNVCLSSINTWGDPEWTPERNLAEQLLILQARFDSNPLVYEPGWETSTHEKSINYNVCVEYGNYLYGIVKMIKNPPQEFLVFHEKMKEIFVEKYEQIEKRVVDMKNQYHDKTIKSPMYGMAFNINYVNVLIKLREQYYNIINIPFDINFWTTYYANCNIPFGIKNEESTEEVVVPSIVVPSVVVSAPPVVSPVGSPVMSTYVSPVVVPPVVVPPVVVPAVVPPVVPPLELHPNKIQKKSKPHVSASKYQVGDLYTTEENVVFKVGLTSNGKKWWYKN